MYRIFRHYIPKTTLMLSIAEVMIMLVSIYLGVTLRFFDWQIYQVDGLSTFSGVLLPTALLFSFLMLGIMVAMGLYQRDLRDGPRLTLIRLTASFALGFVLMTLAFYMFPTLFLGRGAFGIAMVCAFVGVVWTRFLCIQRTDAAMYRRVLVLGAGEKARLIADLRRKTDHRGISVVGYVDIGNGPRLIAGEKIVETGSSLKNYVLNNQIEEIVIAIDDRRKTVPVNDIPDLKMSGIRVIDVATFYERQLGKMKLDSLHPSNVIFSEGFTHAQSPGKRLFDIFVSSVLLLIASPVMILAALAILLESRGHGPIVYRQQRVGKSGKTFEVLKFRSMRVDAEKEGVAQWAQKNDSRVTRVGSFIRKTRIDELPQLINVLRGNMSFVGPRPERPQFVDELSTSIPYYGLRHHVKPGITGWAQICYPYGACEKDSLEKLQYDLYYMKNYSLFLDLTILFQTVQVILWGKGAR